MVFLTYFIFSIYIFCAVCLFIYGLNCYVMLYLFSRKQKKACRDEDLYLEKFYLEKGEEKLAKVTTQIPVFNEYNVCRRVIQYVCAMDYPKGKHQIQVLDDSTDATTDLIDQEVARQKEKGLDIEVIRRPDRAGFKAGALAYAMPKVKGDFVAIFDADFTPHSDYLLRTMPFFYENPKLCLAQARWDHLNRTSTVLTRLQGLGIDGHFMVEQPARALNGLFMNFNGTAGVMRKEAILDAGNWQSDTLTEDMDLSYRMQMKGWIARYSLQTMVPAELPQNILAFKSQQFRWAKGSIQTAKKLLPTILAEPLPGFKRLQSVMHMTHYLVHPLMLGLSLLAMPVLLTVPVYLPPAAFAVFTILILLSMFGPSSLYLGSQLAIGPGWLKRMSILPLLICVGVGLAFSNSLGVFEALIGRESPFVRTPKQGDVESMVYHKKPSIFSFMEIPIGVYCTFSFLVYLQAGKYLVGPFLAMYAIGFLYVGILSFLHARPKIKPKPMVHAFSLEGSFQGSEPQPGQNRTEKAIKVKMS